MLFLNLGKGVDVPKMPCFIGSDFPIFCLLFNCFQTATQIKVMSDLQDEQILLVLTGPGQQNITEAMEKVCKTD